MILKDKTPPKTANARNEALRDRECAIDSQLIAAREDINTKRRDAAEKSLLAWIRTYCVGHLLTDCPPAPHGERIIGEMDEAVGASRPYQILIARGGGKTSYMECCLAYALATGRKRFAVITSINAKQAQQILHETTDLFTSEPFATDYPDIALPIKLLDGHGKRAQRYAGRDTKVHIVSDETVLPTIIDADGTVSRSSGACIRAKALKSVRGTKNGTQRPDLIVLDDLQTGEIATNEDRVADIVRLVRSDVMGLAGKAKASIINTATTIAPDDLTDVLKSDVVWKTTENPAIVKWPTEWMREGHGLWGEYLAKFDAENANDRKHTSRGGSLDFYRKHKDEMDAGADILNWDNFTRTDGQISGLQKLIDAYHQMGHAAFMAEYQMQPIRRALALDISSRLIASRIRRGSPAGALIDGAVMTVAATDINPSYALTTVWGSFDVKRTLLIGGYHITPIRVADSANDTQFHAQVYDALVRLSANLKSAGVLFDAWGIDAGGKQFDPVTRFAAEAVGQFDINAIAMTGRAGKTWNPNVKSKIRAALNSTVMCRDPRTGRKWIAWNADEYKETAQRAWFSEVGSPGGVSLFDANADHTEFATQIANEVLRDKRILPSGQSVYIWRTKEPHDYGDCLAMLYALAGSDGLNGDGCKTRSSRKVAVCL